MALAPSFTLQSGKKTFQVHQKYASKAAEIAVNKNNILDDKEIHDYLDENGDLCGHAPGDSHEHSHQVLEDFKTHLQGKMPASLSSYQSYEEISAQMDSLAQKYPDKAQKVSLGAIRTQYCYIPVF